MGQDASEGIRSDESLARGVGQSARSSRVVDAIVSRLRAAAAWRPHRRTVVLGALLLFVEVVYVVIISSGHIDQWPMYNNYYDLLAEGFRAGHLNLAASPSPELLAKENPLDPVNRPLWMWDASLYHGKIYLYWGPLPAMLQAACKSLFRVQGIVGDQYLVFGFFSWSALCGALLIDRMAERLFGPVPIYLIAFAFLAFAFSNPAPYLVATPGVYQAAIVGGQACLLTGMVPAFDAVWEAHRGVTPRSKLVLAGTAWALALASRLSVAPAVALLILATALASGTSARGRWLRIVRDHLWLGTPVAVGSFALLLYNKLRFDSWFEFGVAHQMSTMKFSASLFYLPANLFSYFLRTPDLSCHFPYVIQWWDHGIHPLPNWLPPADGYFVQEPCVGALVVVPAIWLGAVAVFKVARGWLYESTDSATSANRGTYAWCCIAFFILGTATAAYMWCLLSATMRYLADFTFGLVLLGVLGGLTLWSRWRTRRWTRVAATTLVAGTSVATIVLGLLLGYQGYNNQFVIHNPSLDTKLVRTLSICKWFK
jgi:hypothetical protein